MNCRSLDYERQSVYSLKVTARDSAVHQLLSSTVDVLINVLDVDDCLPVFERPLYRAFVSVDCPVGHEVKKRYQIASHSVERLHQGEQL